ncbi:SGNH/GDSL hydrolase family protein [Flavicella sediminum]|uniref:hypothetical protein n=1 Tax=Flavicella sediminum TaxID=2585141 RepID=UPI0011249473|nr:hypothetical protein [Flavicella sediminum]
MKNRMLVYFLACCCVACQAQQVTSTSGDTEFINYLKEALRKQVVNTETSKEFKQKSWAYWHQHKIAYNLQPEKYAETLELFYKTKEKFHKNNNRKIERYKKKLEYFELFEQKNSPPKNPILFVGSSSISGWKTGKAFPELRVVNRGLGGISLPELLHYYDVLLLKYQPSVVVVYCDIDIEMGEAPLDVLNSFKLLTDKIHNDFPKTHVLLMSMKPTLIDDFLGRKVRENKFIANKLLANYSRQKKYVCFLDITKPMYEANGTLQASIFLSDGMHLNEKGYELWNPIVKEELTHLIEKRKS